LKQSFAKLYLVPGIELLSEIKKRRLIVSVGVDGEAAAEPDADEAAVADAFEAGKDADNDVYFWQDKVVVC
jgi:hypothetical protein